jgi:hypothetical protein
VNAEIDGTDIVYKRHYDIGVAVGTEKGLVVPVLRDADQLGFADIEKTIGDLGKQARDGTLSLEQLQGGTFTISNGGVYGSLMSTPILNAPQSGILGMHKIQERPMVIGGKIESADDVPGAELRPPHRRRQGSRHLPRPHQGTRRRPRAPAAGSVMRGLVAVAAAAGLSGAAPLPGRRAREGRDLHGRRRSVRDPQARAEPRRPSRYGRQRREQGRSQLRRE